MIDQAFGDGPAWTLGVEEELMIVDAESFELVPAGPSLVVAAAERSLPGLVKTELFAAVVELNTRPCGSAPEALAALVELRAAAADLAAAKGLRLLAAGTHPVSRPEEQEIADEPRYVEFVEYAGVSARRQGVNGLHVHVAVPSADACWAALEWILPWLPVVLALSANSPYLAGQETGLASNRADVLAQLPRSSAPPAFGSYAGWERFVERLVALGVTADYTRLWWDVRPHPRFGTLEVRMPDQPTRLELSGAFAALIQAICATAAEAPARAADPGDRGLYQQNRWAALRFGVGAELVHPDGDRVARVPQLAEELIGLVAPAAVDLGGAELLGRLDVHTSDGERQLAIGREDGLEAVCADLVERTLP